MEVRSVTSKWHSVGPVLLAQEGEEHTCLFVIEELNLSQSCFIVVQRAKEALQLPKKWWCDSLHALNPVPGALS